MAHTRARNRPATNDAILVAHIDAQAAEIERLRAGIQAMLDGNYPHPRDHRPGKCPHGAYYYDDCGLCGDEFLAGLLNGPTQETTESEQPPMPRSVAIGLWTLSIVCILLLAFALSVEFVAMFG